MFRGVQASKKSNFNVKKFPTLCLLFIPTCAYTTSISVKNSSLQPFFFWRFSKNLHYIVEKYSSVFRWPHGSVGRAIGYEPEGRRFEFCPCHFFFASVKKSRRPFFFGRAYRKQGIRKLFNFFCRTLLACCRLL